MTPATAGGSLPAQLAQRRLRLADTVEVHEHRYRGHRWYLLRDTLDRHQFRLSQPVYELLMQLDGRRTLADTLRHPSGRVDLRDELLDAVQHLDHAGMLVSDQPPDVGQLLARRRRKRRQGRAMRALRLLSPRLPLFDPDRLLTASEPYLRWLFQPWTLAIVGGLALLAAVQALMHWQSLAVFGAQRLEDPMLWLLLVALYPVVKGLHEFGHGIAAKMQGAEIHETGITLMVFVPVPYVDASAASILVNKYRRMLVGAAGIIVEVLLAALAMLAWLQLADGLLRDAMFAVMLIGGVSTLLFNGNPLLRFDGYYVLCDAVEIPNLATRAGRYYGYLVRRYLFGLDAARSPVTAAGEPGWLLIYGGASTLYRIAISIGIALFLISVVPGLGVLLAAWLVIVQLLYPLWRQLWFLLFSPALAGCRLRANLVVAALLTSLFAVVALLPLPSSTTAEGVVLLPETSIVRAEVDGFMAGQFAVHGAPVAAGERLFELRNRQLQTEYDVLAARVRELAARRDAAGIGDPVMRDIYAERLAESEYELALLDRRRRGLTLRSPVTGELQIRGDRDLPGRLVRQGDYIGYIADRSRAIVRVVASQGDAVDIRDRLARVRVRLAGASLLDAPTGEPAGELTGELLGEVPAASDELPSAALGSRGGGRIAVDARDASGTRALHKVFTFDVAIPYTPAAGFIGSRVSVRFEHAPRPLLRRWFDDARRVVMNRTGS